MLTVVCHEFNDGLTSVLCDFLEVRHVDVLVRKIAKHLLCALQRTHIHATRSHPEMVGDMSHGTLNFDLSKISFVHFSYSRPALTPKLKHVHLLVLI